MKLHFKSELGVGWAAIRQFNGIRIQALWSTETDSTAGSAGERKSADGSGMIITKKHLLYWEKRQLRT